MDLWFDILPALAEKYGWGPDEVSNLTVDQVAMYLCGGNLNKPPPVEWLDPDYVKAQIRASMN